MEKIIVVAASGYFDPIHIGHIEYLKKAKELGDKLVVILNNKEQAILKKGSEFMPINERMEILKALRFVDDVVLSIDQDKSVCKTLEKIKPDIFAKGGDRFSHEIPEAKACEKHGIKIIHGLGDKIQSSSSLIKKDIAIVYVVAGLSNRFSGKIKQFSRVGPNGETLIEYSLNQALKADFTKIIFVVGNKTEQGFKNMFGNEYKGIPVKYAFQEFDSSARDRPWGCIDALCSARDIIDCPFVFCNGDDIYGENTFKKLVNHLKKRSSDAIVGYRLGDVIPSQGKVNRAIIKLKNNGRTESLEEVYDIEKNKLSEKNLTENDLCCMNTFALHLETLKLLDSSLSEFKERNYNDRKVEALIPNEVSQLIKEGRLEMDVYTATDNWYGVTNPEDEYIVREALQNK